MAIPNFKKEIFEPRLPLRREGGLLDRCSFAWENAPVIQLGTKTGWWGNALGGRAIGSAYADLPNEPVQADGTFLAGREALASEALRQVEDNVDEITGIETSAVNPYGDRVDMTATISVDGSDEQIVVHVPGDRDAMPIPPLNVGVIKDTLGAPDVYKDELGDADVYKDTIGVTDD